ncbi:MAG: hypothetical protein D6719_01645 [Candidatus Dadabacteria bacterium]|nr:MAG: hypothetical protein D6719_01645 [Candidatus Dadabacteria bacterium]
MLMLLPGGCSTKPKLNSTLRASQRHGVKLSEVRTVPANLLKKRMVISRAEYRKALALGERVNRLRMVQIFARSEDRLSQYPYYRILRVSKNSVYHMLGLRSGDLVMAADDYVIFDPQVFWKFVVLLQYEKSATIEIVRAGRGILFQYQFVD